MFDIFCPPPEEGDGLTTIDQSVVVRQGDVHHWPNYHLEGVMVIMPPS